MVRNSLIQALVLIILISSTYQTMTLDEQLYLKYEQNDFISIPSKLSDAHFQKISPHGIESHLYFGNQPLLGHRDFRKRAFEAIKDRFIAPEPTLNLTDIDIKCERSDLPNFFKFGGQHVGTLNLSHPSQTFTSPCFESHTISLEITGENSYSVLHKTSGLKKLGCGDGFLYSDLFNYHAGAIYWDGDHKFEFKLVPEEEMESVKKVGIYGFRMCDKVINIVPDFILTLGLLASDLGINLPFNFSSELENDLDWTFIFEGMDRELKERTHPEGITPDKSLIQSGDLFGEMDTSGVDALIMYGSGSYIDHCLVALWIDDELFMLQSGGSGVSKMTYEQFIGSSRGSNVIWLPLKKEYADKFNATGAEEFMNQTLGDPYGYQNFLYSWVDTRNESLPPELDPYLVIPMFSIAESLIPGTDTLLKPAMLKRLNLTDQNMTWADIASVLVDRNMEFPDIFPIPEQDGWRYNGHLAHVCSAYVAAIWKAAGLFDGLDVNAVEFTPRDVYQISFIDPHPKLPQVCEDANPGKSLCQISGKWVLDLPFVSTVEPYSHMNENCPTVPPKYERPTGC